MTNAQIPRGLGFGPTLAALGCATLVDAMGRIHKHRSHILPLVSPDRDKYLFGPAATISFLPWREDVVQASRPFADFFYSAVEKAPEGKVLVLSSGGYHDASHGGGVKLSRAASCGLAGVLADGRLRDFDQLREHGFSTWCRGETVRWGGDVVMPFEAGVAVEFAGVCIVPGDYIFADASGGVVIPFDSLGRVLNLAQQIGCEEAETLQEIVLDTESRVDHLSTPPPELRKLDGEH
ncbi:RraA family protein [Streptomyces sp. NPDC006173]|uniref:RraA family protein n=1 Tax=Streptomyces sp. NPDC006173 TaxID=3155349 RepID=UPI0033EB81F3